MLRIGQGNPLSMRGLETGVRNSKDQPASWLENPSDALKGGLQTWNVDQRQDTDTAGKLAVAKWLSVLCVSLHIHNAERLLLFIASCERQEVRCQVKAGDLRSTPGQLTCHPTLPAGQITDDFPLDLSDKRQQVRQKHFHVDRPLAQKLIIPQCDIIVRGLRHSSLLARWRIALLLVIYHLDFFEEGLEPIAKAIKPVITWQSLLFHREAMAPLSIEVQFHRAPGIFPRGIERQTCSHSHRVVA